MPVCPSCVDNGGTYCVDWSAKVNGSPVVDAGSLGADGKRTFIFPGVFVSDSCSITWATSGAPGQQADPLCANVRTPSSGPNGANLIDVLCADADDPTAADGVYFGFDELKTLIEAHLQFLGVI